MKLGILLVTLILGGLGLLAWAASMVLGPWVWPASAGAVCLAAAGIILGREGAREILTEGARRFWG